MYTREIQPPRSSPIKDGNPLTGTWIGAFEKVDLMEISKPFAWPLPRWVKNSRIKEWHSFSAMNEDIFLEVILFNFKIYRIARISIYDKQNAERYFYKKAAIGSGWILPGSLLDSEIEDSSQGLSFHIQSRLAEEKIKLDFNLTASRRRPPISASLEYKISSQNTPIAVSLGITERRSMYAYKALSPVFGKVFIGGEQQINLTEETCSGFFCDYKGFFFYRTQMVICRAMKAGEPSAGQNGRSFREVWFGFHIVENKTREPNRNNENALWVDGELTPLPPVVITMPYGPEGLWVIQDVEGMIDLTFTPKLDITNADLNAPIGYYNGIMLTKEGQQVHVKNLLGTGEKIILRV